MKRKHVVTTVAGAVTIALVASASLVGCSSSGDDKASAGSTKPVTVRGWAYSDAPLKDASITIRTANGDTVVATKKDATTANGTFGTPAKLPADYRVTVAGGTMGDAVFTGRLVADVDGYGPRSGLIQVNPVTTLLAAYRDAHPGQAPAAAQAKVRRFLQLPDGFDVNGSLQGDNPLFSGAEFDRQAQAAGGIQPFVERLVAEMDAKPARTHAFAGAPQNDIEKDAVSFAAKKLLALGLKSALGIGTPDEAIQNALSQLSAQVADLKDAVAALDAKVDQSILDNAIRPAVAIAGQVGDAYTKLAYGAQHPSQASYDDGMLVLNNLVANSALTNLNTYVVGSSNLTGIYKALSDKLHDTTALWTPATSQKLATVFDDFEGTQGQLVMLLAERSHARESDDEFNDLTLPQYTKQVTAQDALRPRIAPSVIQLKKTPTQAGPPADLMWPSYNQFQFHTAQPAVNGTINDLNGNPGYPMLGFKDWRVPTKDEFTGLVAGRTIASLATTWNRPGEVFTTDQCRTGAGTCNLWTTQVDRNETIECQQAGPKPWTRALLFSVEKGQLVNLCTNAQGYVWPVRTLAAGEKYWM
jgi:hypothetical protein